MVRSILPSISLFPIALWLSLFLPDQLGAQEFPRLHQMDWRKESSGELRRYNKNPEDGPEGVSPFGALFDPNPYHALLPLESFQSDPGSILSLLPVGSKDLSSNVNTSLLYRLLSVGTDFAMLRRVLTRQDETTEELSRLDILLALNFVGKHKLEGLKGEVFELARDEDPWIRRAATRLVDHWSGRAQPTAKHIPPPVAVPEDVDLMVYTLPGALPDPAPLLRAFRSVIFRLGQVSYLQGGSSVSPAQLIVIQDTYILPQIRNYEFIRRFGTWRLDSVLYSVKDLIGSPSFMLYAQGEFEAERLSSGLDNEGFEISEIGEGRYKSSRAPWDVHFSDGSLQVQSSGYAPSMSANADLELKGDESIVALVDFAKLQDRIPWLSYLGTKGAIRITFMTGETLVELDSDGDAKQLEAARRKFLSEREKELEEAEKLISRTNQGASRETFGNMVMALPLHSRASLLQLLNAVEIKNRGDGLIARMALESEDVDHLARAWTALYRFGQF